MIKKLLSVTLCCTVFYTAKSQITKGNWMLGGNISFASTTYGSQNFSQNTAYTFQINPNVGYFIGNKFAAGLKTGINFSGYKATGTDIYSKYNNYNVGPFLRYYFLPTEKMVNILAEGVYQYGLEGGKNQNTSKNTFTFSAGAVAFLNSSVGIEFLMSYSSYKFANTSGSNGTIQLGFGLQVHLIK